MNPLQRLKRNRSTLAPNGKNAPKSRGVADNEGFKPKRSHKGTGSVVFKSVAAGLRRLKSKTMDITHSLSERWGSSRRNDDNQSTASGALSKLDPKSKEAYLDLKQVGTADTLDDAVHIVNQLENFPKISHIQSLGLKNLSTIALQEPEGLANLGVIQLAAKALDKFPHGPKVVGSACLLLWNLGVDNAMKDRMCEEEIPRRVTKVLIDFKLPTKPQNNAPKKKKRTTNFRPKLSFNGRKLKKSQGSQRSDGKFSTSFANEKDLGKKRVLHMACGAVKVLVHSEKAKEIIVGLNGIELVMDSYKYFCFENANDPAPQETCISCLQNFCHGMKLDEYSHRVFVADGPAMVVRSMHKFPLDGDIQKAGCGALWNMSLAEKVATERPEVKDKVNILYKDFHPARARRMELAEVGAGSRILYALIEWNLSEDIVSRALAALQSMVSKDREICNIVREKAHKNEKDLGIINIYDVIFEVYSAHGDHNQSIRDFCELLMNTFSIEDSENTNRDRIEKQQESIGNKDSQKKITDVTVSEDMDDDDFFDAVAEDDLGENESNDNKGFDL